VNNPKPWLVSQIHAYAKLIGINPACGHPYNPACSEKSDFGNFMLVPDIPVLMLDSAVVDPPLCKR